MDRQQYATAMEAFLAMLQRQPNVLKELYPSENAGKELAVTAWAFIEEFHRRHQEKVKG
ncbi:hypothetical protein KAF81_32765 [Pseudomonas aeruginosa]|uniref:hypothetical protein n=1 Tax=Pseudomonadota TaxID=1224 RepID=UPI001B38DAE3|nr:MULTISPECIES: hypothetical protein [Pseudomonadota]MBP8322417.1 hypothetical protein [Pseudomonas aeruginosa]